MVVVFANIFMTKMSQSNTAPIFWERFIDDIISIRGNQQIGSVKYISYQLKYISETETTFLDTTVYKGDRFLKEFILDVRTSFKPTEIFQYTNFYLCHLPCVTKGFINKEALRLLRTNSSQTTFEENVRNFAAHLE